MKKLRWWFKILNLKFAIIKNKIFVLLNKKAFKNKIAIVSSQKWKYKVSEDILLKDAINKMNVDVDIIAWEDENIDYAKYDIIVIRSVWGFQHNIDKFRIWLSVLKSYDLRVINSLDVIDATLSKYEQFKILDKYGIKHIETEFIFKKNIMTSLSNIVSTKYSNGTFVVKPMISASGINTHIISDNKDLETINVRSLDKTFSKILEDINNGIMIQPFIDGIKDGEYSLVFINKNLVYAIKRYPGLFVGVMNVEELALDKVNPNLIEIAKSIVAIPELSNSLFCRVDFAKSNDEYLVMELEYLDPQLFFKVIKNKSKQNDVVNLFAKEIVKQLK